MKMIGRIINTGVAKAEAFVLKTSFPFVGDFDPKTGQLEVKDEPFYRASMAKKVLVCPTGKGGTMAPFIVYDAWKIGNAPAGILCLKADSILCECALVINIPILDGFDKTIFSSIKIGQIISITSKEVFIT